MRNNGTILNRYLTFMCNVRLADKDAADAKILTEMIALEHLQVSCVHENTQEVEVARVPGCDINDTNCITCGKILRRSWCTASDNDPDDHISDWNWWVREYNQRYHETPKASSYRVVDRIDSL